MSTIFIEDGSGGGYDRVLVSVPVPRMEERHFTVRRDDEKPVIGIQVSTDGTITIGCWTRGGRWGVLYTDTPSEDT